MCVYLSSIGLEDVEDAKNEECRLVQNFETKKMARPIGRKNFESCRLRLVF